MLATTASGAKNGKILTTHEPSKKQATYSTMKKNYVMPAQRSIEIDATEMMAFSIVDGGDNNKKVRFSGDDTPVENTSFDGRSSGAWDDEW